jgi:hypothetical protein
MPTYELFSENERFRRAIRWLGEQPTPYTLKLIEEAAREFDLSPADEDFLLRHFIGTSGPNPARTSPPS